MPVLPNPGASRFPLRFSVQSMSVTSRSKSLGLRIRRSTCNRCSNAVPSKGVIFVTSTPVVHLSSARGAPDHGDKENTREGMGNRPHGLRSYGNIRIDAMPVGKL